MGIRIKFNNPGIIAAINHVFHEIFIPNVPAILIISGFAAIAVNVIALVITVELKQTLIK